MNKYEMRQQWREATEALPYGVQRVFTDVLGLVNEGQKQDLVWGADYRDGGACLVNAVGVMLTTSGGNGIPSAHFGDVVGAFDSINRQFLADGVNIDHHVSDLAAAILLQWFGTVKDAPDLAAVEAARAEAFAKGIPYIEPTDDEMAEAFKAMLLAPDVTPFDGPVGELDQPIPYTMAETPFD